MFLYLFPDFSNLPSLRWHAKKCNRIRNIMFLIFIYCFVKNGGCRRNTLGEARLRKNSNQ